MIQPAARTKLACQIAGIDPQRLNEAIHAGTFWCAPRTTAGSARVFEIEDIIILKIFVTLLKAGLSAEKAGGCACNVRDKLKQDPDADFVTTLISQNGIDVTVAGIVAEDEYPAPVTRKAVDLVFCIRDLRKTIEEALQREWRIIGDE